MGRSKAFAARSTVMASAGILVLYCQLVQVDQYLEEVLGGDDALLYSEGNNQQDDSWEKFPEVQAMFELAGITTCLLMPCN
eukprot:2820461-Amphidinium_carterae.1